MEPGTITPTEFGRHLEVKKILEWLGMFVEIIHDNYGHVFYEENG